LFGDRVREVERSEHLPLRAGLVVQGAAEAAGLL